MYDAFLYIVANDGIDTSSSYPYKGKVGSATVYTAILQHYYNSVSTVRADLYYVSYVSGTYDL